MSELQTINSVDLTDTEARAQRDALAGRTDVLDRVGVLRCLPDDMHVTTTEAANFYAVDVDLVRYHLKANRDEFDSDGYRVINRGEFESEFGSLSNLDPRARSVGLFPRRAVLRLGMLLRDSEAARQVRDYLLDAEKVSTARNLSEDEKLFEAFQILQGRNEKLAIANQRQAEKITEDAPKVNYFEVYVADTDCLKLRTVAANNNVGEEWLRDLLVDKGWIYVETERRFSESKGCVEIRRRYSAYAHKRPYFKPVEVHEAPRFKGEVMHTLKVTPAGAEAIARFIAREVAA
ncbi:phage antirepressor KilAC domain-containing protein [Mycolicibacterium fortuitum]|uniref:phage antirepressor KilAC domain-containing protein n=1 Tax=Mycolicibacterium fortuitum TaxID=1766 RepID=UPI00241E0EDF|nr:phage antirepressor KilAC domain-containing protein [Mycolicibacterium fortuitum]MDG5773902.1 phage antirepressor KilAC domain-containing protein [Mycolicibacterium fortuitum]MDG5779713.1 phage antirepressor KilAC domain-containing protein [Mycolicibacterium fortuitum]